MVSRRAHFLLSLACLVCLLAFLFPWISVQAQSGIEMIVHYVEGDFSVEKNAFAVQVYLSVLDGQGKPVMGLTPADFTITEDSQKVTVDTVDMALAPMNLVLLIDTSGTMQGAMPDVRIAASNFVAFLGAGDQVALRSFNDKITPETDFTSDFSYVKSKIKLLEATSGAGTCLYDAAYEAIQLASTLPTGRRAVILLTDGKDETSTKKICSTHTLEDVIGFASKGNTRTPIYILGLGNKVDEESLSRLAEITGGNYLRSPDVSQTSMMFSDLANALKSEYVLSYTSNGTTGPHNVVVEVKTQNATDLDSRDFVLPLMPPSVKITSPAAGANVTGDLSVEAEVSPQGKTISAVIFKLNGEEAGRDDSAPYQLTQANMKAGSYTLEAIALGSDGLELAHSSVKFQIVIPVIPETPTPTSAVVITNTAVVVPPDITDPGDFWEDNGLLLVAGVAALVAVFAGLYLMLRRKQAAGPLVNVPVYSTGQQVGRQAIPAAPLIPEVFGTLIILQSDDPSMVEQVLNLTKPVTQLGRGAQNDIMLPKDTPVSRQHACLEVKNHQLWLSEISTPDESGSMRRPRYGTFVNENKVEEGPVVLHNGDVIRLGSRVKIQVKLAQAGNADIDRTVDNLADRTMDNHDPSA
jgi:VWFA-related protein